MSVNNFIPTVWSENLLHALDRKYVGVANCNREFEGDIREKGNKVKILGLGSVVVSNYTKNTNISTPDTLSDSACELSIDQAKYFNFQIDDIDKAQAAPKIMDAAMKNAANALAMTADRYVYSLYAQAGTTITETTTTENNILSLLIDARTALQNFNVLNAEDIVIEVSPVIAGLILKAKINLSTDNTAAMENGYLGSFGGSKIYVTNNLHISNVGQISYQKCLVRSKRAIAFAEQLSEIEAYRPELRFADAVKGLHLYGAKVVYPAEMVTLDLGIPLPEVSDDD